MSFIPSPFPPPPLPFFREILILCHQSLLFPSPSLSLFPFDSRYKALSRSQIWDLLVRGIEAGRLSELSSSVSLRGVQHALQYSPAIDFIFAIVQYAHIVTMPCWNKCFQQSWESTAQKCKGTNFDRNYRGINY